MKNWILLGMCLAISMGISAQSITEMEYFFDTDPGVGNGTSLSISSSDTVDMSFSIPSNTLTPGMHVMYIRAMDQNGNWSLYQGQTVVVSPSAELVEPPGITRMEYFVDSDPGVGNGTPLSTPVSDTASLLQSLLIGGLAPGPHQLCFRSKNQGGTWGLYTNRMFWVSDSSERPEVPGVLTSEYFFDTDPGIGNGTLLSTALSDTLDATATLSSSSLSPGFHTLMVREKNADQTWGLYHQGFFYVGDFTEAGEAPPLVGLEYFYGTDPGVGNGTNVSFPSTDSLEDWFSFSTTGLGIGTHHVTVRVKDADGVWSFVKQDSFQIQTGCGVTPSLTASGPLEFCHGDSVQLNAEPGYASYLWSSGETSPSIWVTASGNYSVFVVDTAGCSGNSFPVTVEVAPEINGVIFLGGQEIFCEGMSVVLSTSVPYESYLWTNGDTGATTFVSTTGSFNVTVENAYGCSDTLEPLFLEFHPHPPQSSVEQIAPDSLRSSLIGGSYIWYRDFNQIPETTRTIHATQSGIYQVSLLSEFMCQSDKSDEFSFTATGLGDARKIPSLNIFPNPSSGMLRVHWDSSQAEEVSLAVFNALGQEILEISEWVSTGPQGIRLNLSAYPTGLYFLTFQSQSGQARKRIVLATD